VVLYTCAATLRVQLFSACGAVHVSSYITRAAFLVPVVLYTRAATSRVQLFSACGAVHVRSYITRAAFLVPVVLYTCTAISRVQLFHCLRCCTRVQLETYWNDCGAVQLVCLVYVPVYTCHYAYKAVLAVCTAPPHFPVPRHTLCPTISYKPCQVPFSFNDESLITALLSRGRAAGH
jgi:hypothetical protein